MHYAARPVDRSHQYGHEKIEHLFSGFEGALILAAAVSIGFYAVRRLIWPVSLEPLGTGLLVSLLATAINGAVAFVLLRTGRKHDSIILEADGWHLLADVWTSLGVLLGLGLVMLTNRQWLDPILALIVSVNILWMAGKLFQRSFEGLMDRALPDAELALVRTTVQSHLGLSMAFHALRTRRSGASRFIEFHLLVPGTMSVHDAHQLAHQVEDAVKAALPGCEVTIHIEPFEERASWEDSEVARLESAESESP